jgi:hypothetical protein
VSGIWNDDPVRIRKKPVQMAIDQVVESACVPPTGNQQCRHLESTYLCVVELWKGAVGDGEDWSGRGVRRGHELPPSSVEKPEGVGWSAEAKELFGRIASGRKPTRGFTGRAELSSPDWPRHPCG